MGYALRKGIAAGIFSGRYDLSDRIAVFHGR